MKSRTVYYKKEKQYYSHRLIFIFIITFFGFVFSEQVNGGASTKIFLASLTLGGLTLISMMHYLLISRKPYLLVPYRKNILIFLDLMVLTFVIYLSEEYGLFLLPVYIIITMQSGINLGKEYFYISIILASLSWLVLLKYSAYWHTHYEIIATFAITTFLIPLFYLDNIIDVDEKNDQLENKLTEASYDAMLDDLTGLANRKTYKGVLKGTLKQREFFALLFIDINQFKSINITHGHYFGDEVLQEVARRLSAQMEEEDFLARLGGDEFVIITQKKKAFLPKFIEKLEQAVLGEYELEGIKVSIAPSIGVSMYPDDHKEEVMLAKYADEAMYAAEKDPDVYHVFYETIAPKRRALGETFN